MNLQETDYDQFMANEQHIIPVTFRDKALQKLVQEMEFLRAHAVEPLATFLDYISYEFMIDNVMLLLKGTLSGRSANELIKQCHPLGLFKESTMRSIPAFEASPKGYADLYQTVLIDTPVGPYFSQYLQDNAEQLSDASEMRNILEEVQIEVGLAGRGKGGGKRKLSRIHPRLCTHPYIPPALPSSLHPVSLSSHRLPSGDQKLPAQAVPRGLLPRLPGHRG